MIGKCRLCLRESVELQRSHYISAAVYRAIRGVDSPGLNPNPVVVTERGARQTSQQQRAHLLCSDCEQRFSRNGEKWFFEHGLKQDERFKLLDILRSRPPFVDGSPTQLYLSNSYPEIDADAIAYFGTSVFWRGSIYPWRTDGRRPVNLHGYDKQFRSYLLGEAEFPKDAALMAMVREGSVATDKLTYGPVGSARGRKSYYRFPLPGFVFTLTFGPNLTARERRYCIVRGEGRPLPVTKILNDFLYKEARHSMGYEDE